MDTAATWIVAAVLGLSAPAVADIQAERAGALPDDALTPGYANPKVAPDNLAKTVCKKGWAAKQRPPARYLRKITLLQIKNYGVSAKDAAKYVMDFRIPLEVGGHPSDPANLWPQRKDVAWSATAKNKLETYVHGEVCAGRMDLKDAQSAFQKNWIDVFQLYCGPKPDAACNPPGTPKQIETPSRN